MRKFKEGDYVSFVWRDEELLGVVIHYVEDFVILKERIIGNIYSVPEEFLTPTDYRGNKISPQESSIKKMEHEFAIEIVDNKQSVSEAKNRQEGGEHEKVNVDKQWDVTDAWLIEQRDIIDNWPLEQRIGYYMGSLLKCTMQFGTEEPQEVEVKKCIHFAEKLLKVLAEKNQKER